MLLLLIISATAVMAQQKLRGTILERNTGTPVPFVTVQIKNSTSTLTNENGDFELTLPALPAELSISHINYNPVTLQVTTADERVKVYLDPRVMSLKEVTVGNPAITIMQEASDKARKNIDKVYYSKAFLRQTAYQDGNPSYLNEIVFNAGWKPYGLLLWEPTQARHLEGPKGISYTNTSFWSFVISGYVYNSALLKPLTKKVDSLYTFKLAGTYEQNGQEIAKIICTPRPSVKLKRFEGIYYVNTVTSNVVKIEGTIKGLNFTNAGPTKVKNKVAVFIAQYKLNKFGDNVLDYSIFNTSNKLTALGIGVENTDMFSTLYMIDDESVDTSQLKEVRSDINDADLVKATTFNADFWRNNQGIKRTEKEQNAIEILEKTPH
ncbi:carboxypeptidase-like regulatory domain-containing protein [Pedobacter sp. L105]|uniref:carboxypeptidase-like regulatory domain-containing protein n=1 Tax=Pedobacter sp. L105 TaxID=1641871 RepID=UPI00131BD8D2|nr:carboxypeptidase-like regulatory domain-containing protein [Pedobacter sp. L105]